MALLTADDVLSKKFQSVKFREGYDQIEVDEFLDEVVATIYSLTVENNELKERLAAAEARNAELQASPDSAVVAHEPVEVVEAPAEPVEFVDVVEVTPEAVVTEEAVVEPVVEEPVAPVAPVSDAPQSATSMLALAQRLHDEFIEDGKAEANKIVADAQVQADSIVADANSKRDEILSQLADEQKGLEDSINQLRDFESDYRKAIIDHLEGILAQVQPQEKSE